MNSYVGKPLTDPVLDYGPPTAAFDMGDGNRAFIWSRKNQIVTPGYVTTAGHASSIQTGSVLGGVTTNIYTTSTITPPTEYSFGCHYSLFARRLRNDIEGPMAWEVVGFRQPKLMCE